MNMECRNVFYVEKTIDVPIENNYIIDTNGRFLWLQKFASWILKKFGRQQYGKHGTYETIVVDSKKVLEGIIDQLNQIQRYHNIIPKKAYIGRKQYIELVSDKESRNLVVPVVPFCGKYCMDQQMFGIEIQIVPWMEGILII